MKAIYKKRLLKLADLLLANAKNRKGAKFDLELVAKVSWNDSVGEPNKAEVSCGTVVCAMGLAAISDAFFKQGVRWQQNGQTIDMWMRVGGKRKDDYEKVAMHLFGIHGYESEWLFTSSGYDQCPRGAAGERIVAKRLKDFANGKVFAPLPDHSFGDDAIKGRFAPAWA